MSKYYYRVVSANGVTVYSRELRSIRAAKAFAQNLSASPGEFHLEIERVSHPTPSSNRYWMGAWVPWSALTDIADRKPDMQWRSK